MGGGRQRNNYENRLDNTVLVGANMSGEVSADKLRVKIPAEVSVPPLVKKSSGRT